MKTLRFVSLLADDGGRRVQTPQKRKFEQTKTPRARRSRFRLHRTNVSKRVTKLARRITTLKANYLKACPFVGVIVDEGNNWSRACPLYAATISCDHEFRWRIQFVGQENSEGHKDGEGVWKLVKQIFTSNALEGVYDNIYSAGTDGASVMRSTQHFRGWYNYMQVCMLHVCL